jgi:hypothetical protein
LVLVDANQPFEAVVAQLKGTLWQLL